MLLDYSNCLIEITIFYCLNALFIQEPFRWRKLWYVVPGSCIIALYFILVTPQILAVNCVIYLCLALITFYRKPILTTVFIGAVSMLLIITLQFTFYGFLPEAMLQTDIGNLIGNLVILIFVIIILFFVNRHDYSSLLLRFALRFKYLLLIALFIFVSLGQFYISQLTQLWDALPGIISLTLLILFVLLFFTYVQNQKTREFEQQSLYERNLQSSQALMDTMRIQVHDFKHHIHHMQNLIQSAQELASLQEESQQYVTLLEQDRSLYDLVLSIENPGLRAFLFGCCDSCRKNHIELDIQATPVLPAFPLKEYQFIQIAENLMSNAIEQNLLLDEGSRFIEILLHCENGENVLSIENPDPHPSLPIDELFVKNRTTKGGSHQGLGLSSITDLLEHTPVQLSVFRDDMQGTISFSLIYQNVVVQ